MDEFSFRSFPFSLLSNSELSEEMNMTHFTHSSIKENSDMVKLMNDMLSERAFRDLEYKYYTADQLNSIASSNKKLLNLSVFHANIRSLNANYSKLVEFLTCCAFDFDVIILTEIWSTNIDIFHNILDG